MSSITQHVSWVTVCGGGGSSGAGTPVSDSDGPFLDIMFLDRRKVHMYTWN